MHRYSKEELLDTTFYNSCCTRKEPDNTAAFESFRWGKFSQTHLEAQPKLLFHETTAMLQFFVGFCFKFLVSIDVCPWLDLCLQTHKTSGWWTCSQGCCHPQLVCVCLCPSQSMEKPPCPLFAGHLLHPSALIWQVVTFCSPPAWKWENGHVPQFELHLWHFFCSSAVLTGCDRALPRTASCGFCWCASPAHGLSAVCSNSLALPTDGSALSLGCDAEMFRASLPEFECANSWQTFAKAAV